MTGELEDALRLLPPYLTAEDKAALFDEIRRIPRLTNYYFSATSPNVLQGDVWRDIHYCSEIDSRCANRTGQVIVLTNSCDVSDGNVRSVPKMVSIAPVKSMTSFETFLIEKNVSPSVISDKLDAIRKQEVSNLFFLPNLPPSNDDHVAFLDRVQSIHPRKLRENYQNRQATLSQSGFWLFLLKLSIHFCRMQEGVPRSQGSGA